MASEKEISVRYLKYILVLLVIVLIVGLLTLINTGGFKTPLGQSFAWDTSEPSVQPSETQGAEPVITEKECNAYASTTDCAKSSGCCWYSTTSTCDLRKNWGSVHCAPKPGTTPSPDPCTGKAESQCPRLSSNDSCMLACGSS